MNTSVSFELAKLLKEKDYGNTAPWKLGRDYYNHLGELNGDVTDYIRAFVKSKDRKELTHLETIDAPTIAEVIMWLYEKHEIWIVPSYELNIENHKKEWFWNATKDGEEIAYQYKGFNSPTEAYEAAIKYVVKNLVSNS